MNPVCTRLTQHKCFARSGYCCAVLAHPDRYLLLTEHMQDSSADNADYVPCAEPWFNIQLSAETCSLCASFKAIHHFSLIHGVHHLTSSGQPLQLAPALQSRLSVPQSVISTMNLHNPDVQRHSKQGGLKIRLSSQNSCGVISSVWV